MPIHVAYHGTKKEIVDFLQHLNGNWERLSRYDRGVFPGFVVFFYINTHRLTIFKDCKKYMKQLPVGTDINSVKKDVPKNIELIKNYAKKLHKEERGKC